MKKYNGDLIIEKDAVIDFEEITGCLRIKEGVNLTAKSLKRVGGYLSIHSNVTLDAPKLETVGGYLYIHSNVTLPKLETVGGYLSIHSNVTLDAPKLVNKNDKTAKEICKTALDFSFKNKGLIKIDGILSWLVSKKKANDLVIFKVKVVGKLSFSFVVQRGEQFSHGETVQKAVESLRYKLSDRDTSRFKAWKLTTKVSAEDAIQAYRAITGSCEFGVRSFCESIQVPESVTVKKIIDLTQGKYGNEKFAEFFTA